MMQFFCSIILLQIHYKYIILFSAQQTTNKQNLSLSITMAQVPENDLSIEEFLKKYRPETFARNPWAPRKPAWRKCRAGASTRGKNLSNAFARARTVPGAPVKVKKINGENVVCNPTRLDSLFEDAVIVPKKPVRRTVLRILNPLLKGANLNDVLSGDLFVTHLSADI
jgi:hypothetical protein